MGRLKIFLILIMLMVSIGGVSAVNEGNKYLCDNFKITDTSFTADITNQQDGATGGGFYEIKTSPAANHKDVLQSGTFPFSLGSFSIGEALTFTPVKGTKYYLLVYTNYPEHDNRVSKCNYVYDPSTPVNPPKNETNNTNNNINKKINEVSENQPNTIPMKETGGEFNLLYLAATLLGTGFAVARLR